MLGKKGNHRRESNKHTKNAKTTFKTPTFCTSQMFLKSDGEIFLCGVDLVLSYNCPIFAYLTLPIYRNHPLLLFSLSMSFVICTCIPAAFDFRAVCTKVACHLQYSLFLDFANVQHDYLISQQPDDRRLTAR